jgi:hypothetical protein
MTLWPPNPYAIFGIVTFIVASIAVRGWRDLGVLVLLMALLIFPLKWIGPAIGWPALADDSVIWHVNQATTGWRVEFRPSAAFGAAALLGALMILAWKRARTTQARDD